ALGDPAVIHVGCPSIARVAQRQARRVHGELTRDRLGVGAEALLLLCELERRRLMLVRYAAARVGHERQERRALSQAACVSGHVCLRWERDRWIERVAQRCETGSAAKRPRGVSTVSGTPAFSFAPSRLDIVL